VGCSRWSRSPARSRAFRARGLLISSAAPYQVGHMPYLRLSSASLNTVASVGGMPAFQVSLVAPVSAAILMSFIEAIRSPDCWLYRRTASPTARYLSRAAEIWFAIEFQAGSLD
jgi:hypothetical protein